jgi:penicillin-binding protein 1B
LDTRFQEAAAEALESGLERLEREAPLVRRQKEERTLQGLIVVMDPETGALLAMVGGRDYRESQFNRAVQAERQPGSCFKPFVFLAGFESAIDGRRGGLTAATVLNDEPVEIESGGRSWRPLNYDGLFRGPVSAREALESSLNVPTVRAARRVGIDGVARVAERCGFRPFRPLPSLALGAQEVTPLELATAYAALANGGRRASPLVIREVADGQGRLLERKRESLARAVSPQAAFLVTDILRGVMLRGTGSSARSLGYRGPAAGKTGTTDETKDAWFVGYTPEILVLVWVGYDDNARTGLTGASGALPIWVDFMKRVGYADSVARFPEPDGLVREVVDPESGERAVGGCPARQPEWFAAGTEPREDCPLHRPGFFRWLRDRLRRRPV